MDITVANQRIVLTTLNQHLQEFWSVMYCTTTFLIDFYYELLVLLKYCFKRTSWYPIISGLLCMEVGNRLLLWKRSLPFMNAFLATYLKYTNSILYKFYICYAPMVSIILFNSLTFLLVCVINYMLQVAILWLCMEASLVWGLHCDEEFWVLWKCVMLILFLWNDLCLIQDIHLLY